MANIEIKNMLEKILSNTKGQKIVWQYINQNFARWLGGIPPTYNVTLQKTPIGIINKEQAFQYTLSVLRMPTNETILQVISNPNIEPEYTPILEELFKIVIEKPQKDFLNNFTNYINNL